MLKTDAIAHLDLWVRLEESRDEAARHELVELYARVVKYVAGRMAIGLPHYVDHKDLVSAGLLGLIQAVDNYDYRRGNKFETYAIPRIRGAILDELRTQDWFPRSLRRKARQLESAYNRLEARLGRPSTDEELAAELGVSRGELTTMMDEVAVATIVSLDADGSDDDDSSTLGDYLPDTRTPDAETCVSAEEMRSLIASSLGELADKEQLVLVLYYYEELTLKEIGEILDVTESRVCQIHTKAILRLRGKIQRSEGRKSIDRLSREIREQRDDAADVVVAKQDLYAKINIMAGLALPPMIKLAAVLMDLDVPLRT
ncbi:FliA/WhiG family RNA polymerase sigma factor [bacterium]|nr:FliA/WhiG family RNA polymerase sigma factor [bacterium]MBU1071779.1 FliA/WhiG family RNA polymerase sigma factor [bacterium]MBU1674541.1 FliA/WhiG family RNA polymerase sigma factor [bacterium]